MDTSHRLGTMQQAGGGGTHSPDGALQHLEQLENLIRTVEARRAISCDLSDGSPTPASPRALTPNSNPGRNSNFWREVSPQLSYIDNGSSCGASYGRSVSWNLSELPGNECAPRSPYPDHHASSDSLKPRQDAAPPLPPLTPITKSASDTLCSPSHPPVAHSVVVEEKGDIKTKIQKRLSFGDTLDLHTNIYTPAEECPGVVGSLEVAGAADGTANGSSTSLERRWTDEESGGGPPLVRRNSVDTQSQYSLYMDRDLRYYFQHPWLRLIIAYLVIFCNFLLFAEDPVSHSHAGQ